MRRVRELARICVLTALGREAALGRELARTTASPRDIREAILQTYLFAGFPRAINGLWVVNRVLGYQAPARERTREFLKRGEALCRRIYGRDYDPMMRNMTRLHADLAEWILIEGYGKTLARPHFDAKTRELLVVPVLAALRCWRQLPSHIKGTANVGGTRRELLAALDSVKGIVSASALQRTRDLVSKLV